MKSLQMVQDPNDGNPINRIAPEIGNDKMITFGVFAPVGSHFRRATCEEIGCLAFHHGWTFDTAGQPADITAAVKASGRKYTVGTSEHGELLIFEAGQPCFKASEHRLRLDREEIFMSRSGDWRGNARPHDKPTVYSGPDAFVDHARSTLTQFED
jgi:hypothetical protein